MGSEETMMEANPELFSSMAYERGMDDIKSSMEAYLSSGHPHPTFEDWIHEIQ